MPGPAQPATSTVGALLRLIEQEKSKAPHLQTPQAAPSAPAREMAQAPLESPILPESPGSERTVGVKAETLPATTEAGLPATTTPRRALFGEMGGPGDIEGFVNPLTRDKATVDKIYDTGKYPSLRKDAYPNGGYSYSVDSDSDAAKIWNEIRATNAANKKASKPKPTLGEYRGRGKTAAQWYAETGKQSTLDAIGKDVNKSVDLVTGKPSIVGGPRSGRAVVGPEGNVGFQPEAPHAPNNASLQDYLSQGKTREQWYAETGQQSGLDKLGGPGNLKPLPTPETQAPVTPTPTLGQNLMPSSVSAPVQSQAQTGQVLGGVAPVPGTPEYEAALAQDPELRTLLENSDRALAESQRVSNEYIEMLREEKGDLEFMEKIQQLGPTNLSEGDRRRVDNIKSRLTESILRKKNQQ